MKYIITGFCLIICSPNIYAETVRQWWVQCKGNYSEGTCLSDAELSKFKTICSDEKHKDDCRMVVNFVIAKTRISEAKKALLNGYQSQLLNYSQNKKYLRDPEKIWTSENQERVFSFAVGVLPSCNSVFEKSLIFGENLREEVINLKKEIIKVYNSLSSIPCSEEGKGFVLVAIGKTQDSKDGYEVLTIDEKKNYKVINSTLGAGPFISSAN